MEEIKVEVQKGKAMKSIKVKRIFGFIWASIVWGLATLGVIGSINSFNYNGDTIFFNFIKVIIILGAMAIYEFVMYKLDLIRIGTLEYSILPEEHKLKRNYKVILKHKDTAQLQVVNDVNISQDVYDKIYDLYSVDIRYGFSHEGYNFSFNYLTEEEAEKVVGLIKSPSKVNIGIK